MIELLYTTLSLFIFFLPFFFIFKEFKPMKLGLIFFQWILSIILLSDNFYKDHSLYNDKNFNYIQSLDFYPLKSLFKIFDENGSFENISFETMNNSKFSLIKTQKYSIQCLENYYINKDESCPITDIKLGNKNDKIYSNSIQIDENEYIFITQMRINWENYINLLIILNLKKILKIFLLLIKYQGKNLINYQIL